MFKNTASSRISGPRNLSVHELQFMNFICSRKTGHELHLFKNNRSRTTQVHEAKFLKLKNLSRTYLFKNFSTWSETPQTGFVVTRLI